MTTTAQLQKLRQANADLAEGNRQMNRKIDEMIADLHGKVQENQQLRNEIRAYRATVNDYAARLDQKSESYRRLEDKYARAVRGSVVVGLPTGILIGIVATVVAFGVVLKLAGSI